MMSTWGGSRCSTTTDGKSIFITGAAITPRNTAGYRGASDESDGELTFGRFWKCRGCIVHLLGARDGHHRGMKWFFSISRLMENVRELRQIASADGLP